MERALFCESSSATIAAGDWVRIGCAGSGGRFGEFIPAVTDGPTFDGIFAFTGDGCGFALTVQDDEGLIVSLSQFVILLRSLVIFRRIRFDEILSTLGGSYNSNLAPGATSSAILAPFTAHGAV
jgi:hypothetical protein